VDEGAGPLERGVAGDALADPVLDRLDVVIGLALDRLDALAVGLAELGGECAQLGRGRGRERSDLGHARFGGERDEPLGLHPDPRPDERQLTRPRSQRLEAARVAAVERRDRGKRRERHASEVRKNVADESTMQPRADRPGTKCAYIIRRSRSPTSTPPTQR
jgi:hypothetical protein